MADDIAKVYWRTMEVAEMFNTTGTTIRDWCNSFNIKPKRGTHRFKGRDRLFSAEDIIKLKEVHRLIKLEGYTLWGAKRKLGML